jgi:ATP-dependent RNA helicase DeaD
MEQFQKLGICESLLKSIKEHNFEKPSEIQEKTIPLVLEGKDIIAGASTGSGKTLAFGSAILQNTKRDFGIQALVLTPTRELAEQNSKALIRFSKHNPLRITAIYGGVSINPQMDDLDRSEVVIGTPGRILDHLSRGTIELKHLKILVLDEADRMLDMGFREDVEKIISQCPKKRQTLLFSATISEDIAKLAHRYMKDPIEISAEQYVDPTKLTQVYYDVDDKEKYSLLVNLLEKEKAKLIMVFCNTRRNVDFVANNLKLSGIDALPIHGGFSQEKRTKIMEKFNNQRVQILVCTDVAARGLDIKGVSHVYNYDIPKESKEYIHRIGRTARAGKEGKVINIVASRDYENFRNVIKDDSIKITPEKLEFIQRVSLRWLPERRGFDRRDGGERNNFRRSFNNRDNRQDNRRGDDRNNRDDRDNRRYPARRENRSEDGNRRFSSNRSRDSDDKYSRNSNSSNGSSGRMGRKSGSFSKRY